MATHDEIVKALMNRPGVAAGVPCLERALATGRHSPSVATLRKYVKVCGKELQLQVA